MDLKADLKEKAHRIKSDIPAVFMALKDKRTPIHARILAALTVAYALSPLDLIPDFIPVLGLLDDVLLLPAMITLTVKLIPDDVFEECRKKSEDMWQKGRPKKWYFGVPVIIVWIILILFFVRIILRFTDHI